MDSKYGQLFTRDDVERIARHAVAQAEVERGDSNVVIVPTLDEMLEGLPDLTFPADEPLFLLRAQDAAAPDTLHDYRHNSEVKGAEPRHLGHVSVAMREMDDWQAANPNRIKIPD